MARRKLREKKSKFSGTKNILQQINQPSHLSIHDLDGFVTGIPTGGLQGQVLAKFSNDNYDVYWADAFSLFPAIIDGGTATTLQSTFIDGGTAVQDQTQVLDGGSS